MKSRSKRSGSSRRPSAGIGCTTWPSAILFASLAQPELSGPAHGEGGLPDQQAAVRDDRDDREEEERAADDHERSYPETRATRET